MAFKDYYAILGIPPNASHEEVRLAYRRLAHRYHPDLNQGADAEDRFKAINEAHDVLSDAAKRAAYDQMRQRVRTRSDLGSASRRSFEDLLASFASIKGKVIDPAWRDMLRGFFTDAGLVGRAARSARGEDQHATLRVTLADLARGAHRECTVRIEGRAQDGTPRPIDKRVKVRVPAGITPGKRIRLAGMGGEGDPPGDLFLKVELEPHPFFTLDGRNVILRLPITPWEAALGATLKVPTPHGPVQLKVPADAPSGRRMRLAGKGLPGQPAGDLLVELQIHVPPARTPEARAFYQEMAATLPFNPRQGMVED